MKSMPSSLIPLLKGTKSAKCVDPCTTKVSICAVKVHPGKRPKSSLGCICGDRDKGRNYQGSRGRQHGQCQHFPTLETAVMLRLDPCYYDAEA